jgi:class III poly(R)-hydroxyalkanoic acid synthase PhaE subunit
MNSKAKDGDAQAGTDAAGALFKTWSDAQSAAMKNWAEMAAGAMQGSGIGMGMGSSTKPGSVASASSKKDEANSASSGSTGNADAGSWAFGPAEFKGFMATWKRLSDETMNQVMAGKDPGMRALAEQMRAAQETAFQTASLMNQAWLGMAQPSDGPAMGWQDGFDAFTKMGAGFTSGPATWTKLQEDSQALWQQYLAWMEQSLGPLMKTFQPDASFFSTAGDPSKMFKDMTERSWDAFEQMSGKAGEGMKLGLNRQSEERMQKGFAAWVASKRASNDYQMMLGEAWSKAFSSAFEALSKRASDGNPVSSLKELSAFWTLETDRVMEATFASEPYAKVQAQMLNTAMRYQKIEREIADGMLKGSHLASRTELDDAYRAIQELRRELRAMRREMDAHKGASA